MPDVAAARASPRARRALAWCGVLLLAAYVLPVYWPPAATPILRLPADAGMWKRLFPQVPGWWMALRLGALGVGATMLALACTEPGVLRPRRRSTPDAAGAPRRVAAWASWSAFALAGSLVAAATQAAHFSRAGQSAFVLALALPALVVRLGEGRTEGARPRLRRADAWLVILIGGWVAWRIVWGQHDPRAADAVDIWKNFGFFVATASDQSNVLTQGSELGFSNVYLLALGLPFVGPGRITPTFAWVQAWHAVWIVATALGVAGLSRRIGGRAAMLPAVAALLCSPFMLSMALVVAPFALLTALAAALLVLVCRIHEEGAASSVVALGALGGLGVTFPHLTLWSLAAAIAVLPCLRRRQPPLAIWAIAALVGLAAVTPILPNLVDFAGLSAVYVQRRGVGTELEQLNLGQRFYSHRQVEALWHAGVRGVFDIPVAAILQPFAISRFPLRLSGDVYYEPCAAALAAAGLATCIRQARRSVVAAALLAAVVVAVLPGAAASAADRASLLRNLPVAVVLPLFTVVGLAVAARALGLRLSRRRLALGSAAVFVVSGIFTFDVVNPRIVATSWLSIALRAVAVTPAEQVLLLEHGNPPNDWMHVAEIGGSLPPTPLRVRAFENAGSLLAGWDDASPASPLILWSPSLAEQSDPQRDLCRCWPRATLYTMSDAAGLSRAFAARLDGRAWTPALPAAQWSSAACPSGPVDVPCDGLRALAHVNHARALVRDGHVDAAIEAYREAIALDASSAVAHDELGSLLVSRGAYGEAIAQHRAAVRLLPDAAPMHNNLAIALESAGDVDAAIAEYSEAVRLAPTEVIGRLNLGTVLGGRGRPDEALAQFDEVVRLAPHVPEAQLARAEILARQGRLRDAVDAYRAALRIRPDWPPAAAGLAWMLATSDDTTLRDPAAALALAARVAARPDADAATLRIVAVTFEAAGRYEDAAQTIDRALQLAEATGQEELARDLGQRAARYRTRLREHFP